MKKNTSRTAGSATAETAVVLPVLVAVAALAAWALGIAAAQLTCAEAARAAARAAARGDPPDVVRERARQALGGRTAEVRLRDDGDRIVVEVTARVPGPVPRLGALVAAWQVRADATALREDAVPEPSW